MAGTPPDYDNVRWAGPDGLRVPLEMGKATLAVTQEQDINVGTQGTANVVTLQSSQLRATVYYVTNASGAASLVWPAVLPGVQFTINNQSGQALTAKVTGKTGIVVASTKKAILAMDATSGDIVRVTADT